MGRGSRLYRLYASHLIGLILLADLTQGCKQPWTATGCAQKEWINILGQPVNDEPKCNLYANSRDAKLLLYSSGPTASGITCNTVR